MTPPTTQKAAEVPDWHNDEKCSGHCIDPELENKESGGGQARGVANSIHHVLIPGPNVCGVHQVHKGICAGDAPYDPKNRQVRKVRLCSTMESAGAQQFHVSLNTTAVSQRQPMCFTYGICSLHQNSVQRPTHGCLYKQHTFDFQAHLSICWQPGKAPHGHHPQCRTSSSGGQRCPTSEWPRPHEPPPVQRSQSCSCSL